MNAKFRCFSVICDSFPKLAHGYMISVEPQWYLRLFFRVRHYSWPRQRWMLFLTREDPKNNRRLRSKLVHAVTSGSRIPNLFTFARQIMVPKNYSSEVVPLVTLAEEKQLYLLELFHGPTSAFKHASLQFVGSRFEYFLVRRNQAKQAGQREHLTILGATSGDTDLQRYMEFGTGNTCRS